MKDLSKVRTRNWAFIMYPDSMPNNDYNTAVRIIADCFMPFAISPLHDRDFNADGEVKKPHYHVLITADGIKSYKQILEISKSVNGSDVRPIDSAVGYYRYFTHKDNPEKAQYNDIDIKCYNNFNAELYNKPTSLQRYLAIKEMVYYIRVNKIYSFCHFVNDCIEYNFEWFKLLCDNSTILIKEYISSFRFVAHNDESLDTQYDLIERSKKYSKK